MSVMVTECTQSYLLIRGGSVVPDGSDQGVVLSEGEVDSVRWLPLRATDPLLRRPLSGHVQHGHVMACHVIDNVARSLIQTRQNDNAFWPCAQRTDCVRTHETTIDSRYVS